ncbi:hypothetical protein [Dactylosporangium sp. NPDC005555]|uniref:hypothetical protein n=1 Tax=Dactylosporangium sp. NPDC005555 TaxID=3154889 RepID=UPI0033B9EE15
MAGVPRVVASGELVARVDGIAVHLLTVEAWAGRVAVRAVGVPDDDALAAMRAHEVAMAEWYTSAAAAGTRPPRSPADVTLEAVRVQAEQGGVPLRPVAWSHGGTGTEWLGQWVFEAGLPTGMVRIVVEAGDDRWSETLDLTA